MTCPAVRIWIPVFAAGLPPEQVEALIPFARLCCGKWIKRYYNERDDIVSVAYMALVKAAKAWPGEGNLKGYIKVSIDHDISGYLIENKIIRVPRDEVRKQLAKEEPKLPKIWFCSQNDSNDITIEKLVFAKEVNPLGYEAICKLLKLSDYEQTIVDLRYRGHTLTEIGKLLSVTHPAVLYHLKQIQKRYEQLLKQYPDLPRA